MPLSILIADSLRLFVPSLSGRLHLGVREQFHPGLPVLHVVSHGVSGDPEVKWCKRVHRMGEGVEEITTISSKYTCNESQCAGTVATYVKGSKGQRGTWKYLLLLFSYATRQDRAVAGPQIIISHLCIFQSEHRVRNNIEDEIGDS